MRRLLLVAILMAPLSAYATEGQPAEWTSCASDEDCVVAVGMCKPVAVNANYKSAAEAFFAQRKTEDKCAKNVFWGAQTADQVEARCRLERCEIVGK